MKVVSPFVKLYADNTKLKIFLTVRICGLGDFFNFVGHAFSLQNRSLAISRILLY